jgi:hypothetical protein
MRRPVVLAISVVALLGVAGGAYFWLHKPAPAPVVTPPPVQAPVAPAAPTEAAAPFFFDQKDANATVSLKLPKELGAQPDLHAKLYAEAVQGLKSFAEGAANERAELQGEGSAIPAYSREIDWATAAETPTLLSLRQETTEYAGGAHGNLSYDTLLWDKALKKQVASNAVFKAKADLSGPDKALCAALTAAKHARLGANFEPQGEVWKCPSLADTPFVLAASTQPGKIGGITVLLAPYAAGAYAEGPYEIALPASDLTSVLAPVYADQFAGAPVKVGDTTDMK